MLALTFREGDYAFVYHNGTAIGAILFGDERPPGRHFRVPVRFSGLKDDFEILRPKVVEHRYGKQELDKLAEQFLLSTANLRRLGQAR